MCCDDETSCVSGKICKVHGYSEKLLQHLLIFALISGNTKIPEGLAFMENTLISLNGKRRKSTSIRLEKVWTHVSQSDNAINVNVVEKTEDGKFSVG